MKSITLDAVKYEKCQCCGRGFPKAHWILPPREEPMSKEARIDKFTAHNNKLCSPCIDINLHNLQ